MFLDPLEKRESEKLTTPGPTCGFPLGWAGALQGALIPTDPPLILKEQHSVKVSTLTTASSAPQLWHTVVWSQANYLAFL